MRILRAENYRRMKWKNGGGETAEISVFPDGAVLEDFGWRVSMATVASDGPFSAFGGVDRTLTVLEGEGIALDVEGRGTTTLTPTSAPFSFPGDAATSGRLVDGPITDLNVMARRGQYGHKVVRYEVDGTTQVSSSAAQTAILFCAAPSLRVIGGGVEDVLDRYDVMVLTEARTAFRVEGHGNVFLIELERLA
jgi:environmental stress-induced protein Ves